MIANPRILYLDDCPKELGQYITELCEHFHASIDLAKNIQEAENRLQKSDYDLFLLDIEISGTRSTNQKKCQIYLYANHFYQYAHLSFPPSSR